VEDHLRQGVPHGRPLAEVLCPPRVVGGTNDTPRPGGPAMGGVSVSDPTGGIHGPAGPFSDSPVTMSSRRVLGETDLARRILGLGLPSMQVRDQGFTRC
jgi:hypothetical protein